MPPSRVPLFPLLSIPIAFMCRRPRTSMLHLCYVRMCCISLLTRHSFIYISCSLDDFKCAPCSLVRAAAKSRDPLCSLAEQKHPKILRCRAWHDCCHPHVCGGVGFFSPGKEKKTIAANMPTAPRHPNPLLIRQALRVCRVPCDE